MGLACYFGSFDPGRWRRARADIGTQCGPREGEDDETDRSDDQIREAMAWVDDEDGMSISSSHSSVQSTFSWCGRFAGGRYCRPAELNTIACDICGFRISSDGYEEHRRTGEHIELRTKWEVTQAEKVEHERRVDELAALTNNPDTSFAKHVMAASQFKSTQDRGVQGPTRHLGASDR